MTWTPAEELQLQPQWVRFWGDATGHQFSVDGLFSTRCTARDTLFWSQIEDLHRAREYTIFLRLPQKVYSTQYCWGFYFFERAHLLDKWFPLAPWALHSIIYLFFISSRLWAGTEISLFLLTCLFSVLDWKGGFSWERTPGSSALLFAQIPERPCMFWIYHTVLYVPKYYKHVVEALLYCLEGVYLCAKESASVCVQSQGIYHPQASSIQDTCFVSPLK